MAVGGVDSHSLMGPMRQVLARFRRLVEVWPFTPAQTGKLGANVAPAMAHMAGVRLWNEVHGKRKHGKSEFALLGTLSFWRGADDPGQHRVARQRGK